MVAIQAMVDWPMKMVQSALAYQNSIDIGTKITTTMTWMKVMFSLDSFFVDKVQEIAISLCVIADVPKEMPKLVPFEVKTLPPKSSKPIHQRLGERGSICESIHTSQMNLFQPKNFKAKQRRSVQNRLGKAWVNPLIQERNRIALHTLKSIVDNPQNIQIDGDGLQLLSAFAKAIKSSESAKTIGAIESADQKYDMAIQKEISMVQVSYAQLFVAIYCITHY